MLFFYCNEFVLNNLWSTWLPFRTKCTWSLTVNFCSDHLAISYGKAAILWRIKSFCSLKKKESSSLSRGNIPKGINLLEWLVDGLFYNVRGACSKFPDFFVQAFKIVVDSWEFSMLLLYILWDDWPIFMISGSNKQIQQELEFTLLKPDCHSYWISKMQSGRENTLEERYTIKFCFKLGKKCHRNVWNASECFWCILHESSISFWVA